MLGLRVSHLACAGFPVANIKGLLQNTAVPQTYIDLGTAQKTTLPAPVRAHLCFCQCGFVGAGVYYAQAGRRSRAQAGTCC